LDIVHLHDDGLALFSHNIVKSIGLTLSDF